MEALEAEKDLIGESLTDRLIESAASKASATEITPFGNIHTSPEFQRHLANVLTKKALKQASQRAEGIFQ
jgi:CO/xanthine dehydrogenase FAD-binding subunit